MPIPWFSTRKTMGLGAQVNADKQKEIEAALTKLEEAAKGDDLEKIKSETEAVTKILHELSAQAYQQAGGQEQAGADGDATFDAEATDVKDDKE